MISRVLLIVSCLIVLAACLNDEDNSTTTLSSVQEDEFNNLNKTHNKSDVVDPIKARFLPFLVPLFIINRARGNNGTDSNDTTSATSNLTTEIPRIERAVNLTDLPGDLDKQLNATDDLVMNSTRNESSHHTRAMDVSLKTSNFSESQNESSKADEDWDDLATLLSNVTDSEDEWDDDMEADQEELIENALLPLRLLARHSENSTLNDTSDFELDDDNNSSEPDNKPTGPHIFRMVIIDRIVPEVVNESSVLNSTSSNRTRRDVRYGAPPPYAAQPTYPPAYPAYPAGAATEPASYDAMAYYATPAAPSYPPAPAYAQPVIYATPVSPSYYTAPPAYTTTASYSYVVQQQPTYPSPASYKPSAYGPASYQQLDYAPASNDVPSYAAAPAPSYSAPNPPPAAYGPPPPQQQPSYAQQPAGPATYPAPPARPAGLPTPPTTESPWF